MIGGDERRAERVAGVLGVADVFRQLWPDPLERALALNDLAPLVLAGLDLDAVGDEAAVRLLAEHTAKHLRLARLRCAGQGGTG